MTVQVHRAKMGQHAMIMFITSTAHVHLAGEDENVMRTSMSAVLESVRMVQTALTRMVHTTANVCLVIQTETVPLISMNVNC